MEYWSEVAACSVRLHQCKEDRPPVFAPFGARACPSLYIDRRAKTELPSYLAGKRDSLLEQTPKILSGREFRGVLCVRMRVLRRRHTNNRFLND
jgi:hypothetical protein